MLQPQCLGDSGQLLPTIVRAVRRPVQLDRTCKSSSGSCFLQCQLDAMFLMLAGSCFLVFDRRSGSRCHMTMVGVLPHTYCAAINAEGKLVMPFGVR